MQLLAPHQIANFPVNYFSPSSIRAYLDNRQSFSKDIFVLNLTIQLDPHRRMKLVSRYSRRLLERAKRMIWRRLRRTIWKELSTIWNRLKAKRRQSVKDWFERKVNRSRETSRRILQSRTSEISENRMNWNQIHFRFWRPWRKFNAYSFERLCRYDSQRRRKFRPWRSQTCHKYRWNLNALSEVWNSSGFILVHS